MNRRQFLAISAYTTALTLCPQILLASEQKRIVELEKVVRLTSPNQPAPPEPLKAKGIGNNDYVNKLVDLESEKMGINAETICINVDRLEQTDKTFFRAEILTKKTFEEPASFRQKSNNEQLEIMRKTFFGPNFYRAMRPERRVQRSIYLNETFLYLTMPKDLEVEIGGVDQFIVDNSFTGTWVKTVPLEEHPARFGYKLVEYIWDKIPYQEVRDNISKGAHWYIENKDLAMEPSVAENWKVIRIDLQHPKDKLTGYTLEGLAIRYNAKNPTNGNSAVLFGGRICLGDPSEKSGFLLF